jgi:hypothetical protein
MGELAHERSGPERFLSSFALLRALLSHLGPGASAQAAEVVGTITAQLMVLRRMSHSVAAQMMQGADPSLTGALVKDLGGVLEQEIPEAIRCILEIEPSLESNDPFQLALARTMLYAPSFSIRGGAREILRGIIARGLGLR